MFHSSWKTFHEIFFLKLFPHHLYYEFIVSIYFISCIGHLLTYPVKKKCFVFFKQSKQQLKLIEVVFHSFWKGIHEPIFLKLFLHHLYSEFIVSMYFKWCIEHLLTYPVRKKYFVFMKQSIKQLQTH